MTANLLAGVTAASITAQLLETEPPVPIRRYWRMLALSGWQAGLDYRDIAFTIDGVDQTSPALAAERASASSFYTAGNLIPANAFDASSSSRWASSFDNTWPQWIQWDFGVDTAINGMSFILAPGGRTPQHMLVQHSTNGIGWTTVYENTAYPSSGPAISFTPNF